MATAACRSKQSLEIFRWQTFYSQALSWNAEIQLWHLPTMTATLYLLLEIILSFFSFPLSLSLFSISITRCPLCSLCHPHVTLKRPEWKIGRPKTCSQHKIHQFIAQSAFQRRLTYNRFCQIAFFCSLKILSMTYYHSFFRAVFIKCRASQLI